VIPLDPEDVHWHVPESHFTKPPTPSPTNLSPITGLENLNASPLPTTTRSGRAVKSTWKVRDQLPELPGTVDEHDDALQDNSSRKAHPVPRICLLLTERIKTAATRFGLSRLYKRRPVALPDPSIDLHAVYTPTEAQRAAPLPKRAIKQIITPFPNLSSFLFGGHHHWLSGNKKSQNARKSLQEIITRPDFSPQDIAGVDFNKLDEKLSSSDIEAPWVRDKADWQCTSVTIGVRPLRRFPRHQSAMLPQKNIE
jgi:hypothetical protein